MPPAPDSPQQPGGDAPDERAPWLGLDAFTELEKERFCGRDADVEELAQRVKREVGTVLYGQSGLGKTSLLQAGLSPRLTDDHYLPILIRLIHKSDAPPLMDQVRLEISRALGRAALFEPVLPDEGEDLWRYLHRRDVPFLTEEGYDLKLVLIFDQFEEIFTNGQATPVQARRSKEFFAQLAELIQGRTPESVKTELQTDPESAEKLKLRDHDYHLLVTLREDYLPHLDTAVERFMAPDLVRNRQRLLPFDGQSALAAVEGPGAGLIEPGVAEKIVRKVAAARQRHLSVSFLGETDEAPLELTDLRIEPALLSLLCSRLNALRLERQKQSHTREYITADLLEGMGGRVLESFYEDSLNTLPKPDRDAVASFIEEKLLSESGQHRQQVVMDSAEKTLVDGGLSLDAARQAIEHLIKQRLLRIEDRGDVPRLELTHDVLCAVVGRFRDQRRAWRQRLQWWKNAAAAAAAIFFFAALYFAFDASQKREEAEKKGREAMVQKDEAEKQAGLAKAATDLAEQEKGKARDAENNALLETGRHYAKYVRLEADKKNLSNAAVYYARGLEIATMRRPEVFGYVAGQPMLTGARKFTFDEPTTRVAWAGAQRRVLGLTKNPQTNVQHLWVLDGDFREPRWLQDKEGRLVLAPFAATGRKQDDHRVRVLAAIPWRSPDGHEAVLASVFERGLARIHSDGTVSAPQRILGSDPTAFVQDPISGLTWIGLTSGIVVKLDAAAAAPDRSFTFFVASRRKEQFQSGRVLESASAGWRYEPLRRNDELAAIDRTITSREREARSDDADRNEDGSTFRRLREEAERREQASPVWRLVNTKANNQPVTFQSELTRQMPSLVVFSRQGQEVLFQIGSLRQVHLFKLPATSSKTRGPTPPRADETEKREGSKEGQTAASLTPHLLETAGRLSAAAFVGNGNLLALADNTGELRLFQISDGKLALSISLQQKDYKSIDRLVATEDGNYLAVLQKSESDDDENLRLTILRLKVETKSVTSTTVASTIYSGNPRISFTEDGSQALIESSKAGVQQREWLRVNDGKSSPEVPWETFAPGLRGPLIGGLALDAQRGLLAISCSNGIGFANAATGATDNFFLEWPNPQPHLLISSASRNGFLALADRGHFWQVAHDPYLLHEIKGLDSVSITIANRQGEIPDAITAFTEHPSGRLAATGWRDGSIRFQRHSTKPGDEFFEQVPAFGQKVGAMAFSPDGTAFAAADESGALTLWSVLHDPLPQLPLVARKDEKYPSPVELPDGRFAFADRAGLQLWNPATSTLVPFPLRTAHQRVLALGPGGKKSPPCAVVQETETRLTWIDLLTDQPYATADLAESTVVRPQPQVTERLTRLASVILSPEGRRSAVLNHRGEVEFWSLPAPVGGTAGPFQAQRSALTIPERISNVAFDATGRWALLVPQEGRAFVLDLNQDSLTRREVEGDWKIRAAVAIPGTEAFLLATGEGTFSMDCARERLSDNDRYSETPATIVGVSPDGLLALTAGSEGEAMLLDLQERRPLGPLAHADASDFQNGAFFSADSRRLLGMSPTHLRWWQPAPALKLAQARLMTGLTVNAELDIAPAVRHGEDLRQISLPAPNPMLVEAWQAMRELPLRARTLTGSEAGAAAPLSSYPYLRAALEANNDLASLPPSLRVQARELPPVSVPDTARLQARQACLLSDWATDWGTEAQQRFYTSPTTSLAAWPGELRGEWTWMAAVHRLAQTLDKGNDAPVVASNELNSAVLQPLQEALQECRNAVGAGFAPKSRSLPRKVRYLLDELESAATYWNNLTTGDLVENRRRALPFKRWIAEFRQDDGNAWNGLGVSIDALATTLRNQSKQSDGDAGQNEEAQELDRESIAAYQRAVFESETGESPDNRAYALGNWSNNLAQLPEGKFTEEERKGHRRIALDLAREATRVGPKINYVWRRLAELAVKDDEKLEATKQRVATAKDATADELKSARRQLGVTYRNQRQTDKAIDTFEKLVQEDAADVYSLVEIGELLRSGGYPLEECLVPFQAAVKADATKPMDKQDQWGQWRFGLTYEQWGRPAEAEAAYRQALQIARAHKASAESYRFNLATVLLRSGRWADANPFADELKKTSNWANIAGLGSRGLMMATTEEQKATAVGWLNTVLEATKEVQTKHWAPRSTALVALGRQPEALELLQRREMETQEDERTTGFWLSLHLARAEAQAETQPASALQELALAITQGWQDAVDLWSNERLDRPLNSQPAYTRLRGALLEPFDAPKRFVALAHFQIEAAAAFAASGNAPSAAACTQTAAKFLADATRRGWNPSIADLGQPPLDQVTRLPAWADLFAEARQDAARELRAEAIVLAKALDDARAEKGWKTTDDVEKEWSQISAKLVGHAGLKRRSGRDFYGEPYLWDTRTGKVRPSARTLKLVGPWIEQPDEFWIVDANSNE